MSAPRRAISPALARMLRILVILPACVLLAIGILAGIAEASGGGAFWRSKMCIAATGGALLLLLAAWRGSGKLQFRLAALAFVFIAFELLLQVLAWSGLMPGISTKIKCAYARVCWTTEGHGNGIRNRDGWYYPEFDLTAKKRIVAIGDSFTEAVEVRRSQNHAALLHTRLHSRDADTAVLALGTHGTSPAHHLEVIDYAKQHFAPQEAVLFLYLGNDLTEQLPELNPYPPSAFIYYAVQPDGRATILPESETARTAYRQRMEFCHRPLTAQAPLILNSHCMILQTIQSIRGGIEVRRRIAASGRGIGPDAAMRKLGLDPAPFAVPPTPVSTRAQATLLAVLDLCREACAQRGMLLRLVTIPAFPREFYAQTAKPWTAALGGSDYLAPERAIAEFAAAKKIPFLGLGAAMQQRALPLAEIQSFYHFEGTGHFTEAGHRFCADAVEAAFYAR